MRRTRTDSCVVIYESTFTTHSGGTDATGTSQPNSDGQHHPSYPSDYRQIKRTAPIRPSRSFTYVTSKVYSLSFISLAKGMVHCLTPLSQQLVSICVWITEEFHLYQLYQISCFKSITQATYYYNALVRLLPYLFTSLAPQLEHISWELRTGIPSPSVFAWDLSSLAPCPP